MGLIRVKLHKDAGGKTVRVRWKDGTVTYEGDKDAVSLLRSWIEADVVAPYWPYPDSKDLSARTWEGLVAIINALTAPKVRSIQAFTIVEDEPRQKIESRKGVVY